MKSLIAYVAIATLLVSSAVATQNKFTVTCNKATHAVAFYTKTDCTGEHMIKFGMSTSGECVEVPKSYQSNDGVSVKLTVSPDGTTMGQVGYLSKACTGTEASTYKLLGLDNYTIGECKAVGTAYGVKAMKLTSYATYKQGPTCGESEVELSYSNGVCYSNMKITCSDDAKKYDLMQTADTCDGSAVNDYKGHEAGKCYDYAELAGAGKPSLFSSFAIIALAFVFLQG